MTSHDTVLRNRVWELGPSDWKKALEIARSIQDPWYRCQSLAYVAENCPDPKQQIAIVQQAFKAGEAATGPNRIVTVSSWPLHILNGLHRESEVRSRLERFLQIIATEPHPVRRMHGLAFLLHAVHPRRALFLKVLEPFKEACRNCHSWRVGQAIPQVAYLAEQIDSQLTSELLDLITVAKARRRAERQLFSLRTQHLQQK